MIVWPALLCTIPASPVECCREGQFRPEWGVSLSISWIIQSAAGLATALPSLRDAFRLHWPNRIWVHGGNPRGYDLLRFVFSSQAEQESAAYWHTPILTLHMMAY